MTSAASAKPVDAAPQPKKSGGAFNRETVTEVRQYTDRLFSFRTTRDPAFRFENGQFAMIGLEVDGRPLLRAYSMASSNYDEGLEFYSIKVENGPLTSRLRHIEVGDTVLVGRKPTGTLVQSSLLPGKRLYLLSTGTGVAPFASIIRDPDVYERYERIVLVHGCRQIAELQYGFELVEAVKADEFLGDLARGKLVHYATATREPHVNQGRITAAIESRRLFETIGAPDLAPAEDRVMICGGPQVLTDLQTLLEQRGFVEGSGGAPGTYVVEKAFAER
jgi:ferredoxin/flavodoxin---NADP+ reductase